MTEESVVLLSSTSVVHACLSVLLESQLTPPPQEKREISPHHEHETKDDKPLFGSFVGGGVRELSCYLDRSVCLSASRLRISSPNPPSFSSSSCCCWTQKKLPNKDLCG